MIIAMKPRALLSLLLSASLLCSPLAAQADALALPDLGDASQTTLSPQAEQKLGRQIMAMIRESGEMLDDPEVELYLNQLGRRLSSASPELGQNFQFFPMLDPQINAFALPGGYIGVHTGLIYTAQSESELASVIGHEMAHVVQHHIARSMVQQGNNQLLAIAGLLVAILAASVSKNSQVSAAAVNAGTGMAIQNQLTFSREFEREADNIGMQILSRAGFDARAMPMFFERMQRLPREQQRQHDGGSAQRGQHPAGPHLRKQLALYRIHREHQPCGHGQGGGKAKARRLAPQPPHQQGPVQHPGHQQRVARRRRPQAGSGCGGCGVCQGGGKGQQPTDGGSTG